ncbi:hypothetical protein BD324DRAFT_597224 [Kockovaella imperatae]|uniref:DUF221-domain-containing protein n=1 Tax=Kockovaella imperatae TaxID=4999 RepID=A0A1Y1UNU4_9TREE|nr:hypothetical protein BD324DRAFT_597224 [Kockovaella imperatae]ORX39718.1 hypothetical protein BD324DRAFT_597224 [Kockovaella imperatae]
MAENANAQALSASTSSFVTSLAVNSAIAGGEIVAFILLRRWIKAIYEPRTYVPPKAEQAQVLSSNLLWPVWKIIFADPEEILNKNGVDPYVFVRFLIMMCKAMVPIWLLSWVVLMPIDSVNTGSGKTGVDRFTFGNISNKDQNRLWAHLILDIVFIGWIIYLIVGEMHHWLVVRQKYLISPAHSRLPQASTILVTGIPNSYMDEQKLQDLYSPLPGGVKSIWLNRNLKDMPDLWDRRTKAAQKLESAEVSLIKAARKRRAQNQAKIVKLQAKGKPIPDSLTGPANPDLIDKVEQLSLADQLVPRSQRPTMRLKPKWAPFGLGFLGIGEKVDTIEWARKEILEVEPALQKCREKLQDDIRKEGSEGDFFPPRSSAFIRFNQQIAAHMATEALSHNMPYAMANRYIEQAPENVIWRSLGLDPYEAKVRQAISYALTGGLIIGWSFPVAFIGILSSVSTLTKTFHWLAWIQGKSFGKRLLQGVISGIIPPVLLALLMLLLPAILRQLAAFEGKPSKTEVELDVMNRYFVFLVINTFFIVTLASGLVASVLPILNNPGSVANILAKQLPTASTFFLTLILTQLTGLAGTLLQVVSLAFYYIKVILLGGSPRSVFSTRYTLQTPSWGTDFPGVTVYAVIMLAYCVISPIVNGFAAAYFAVAAVVYKYLYIWVVDQPESSDTGGLFFPKAINHVFVGIYIQEVCLCALFFLSRNEKGNVAALPQAIIMIVVIVATAGIHYVLMASYKPLRHSLPLSLAHLSYGMPRTQRDRGESMIGEESDDEAHRIAVEKALQRPAEDARVIQKIVPRRQGALEKFRDDLEKKAPRGYVTSSPEAMSPVNGTSNNRPPSSSQGTLSPTMQRTPGYPTSAGPPVGSTHALHEGYDGLDGGAIEMGNVGQTPDPELEEDQPAGYLVQPGGPGIRNGQETDPNDPYAFFHPATKEKMRVLWLPRDELGLCKAEIEACEKMGIKATSRHAILTSKGNVRIFGPPPDNF